MLWLMVVWVGNLGRAWWRQLTFVAHSHGQCLGLEDPRWRHSRVQHRTQRLLYWLTFESLFSLSLHFSSSPLGLSSQIIGLS